MNTPKLAYNVGAELVPPPPARMPDKEANMREYLTPAVVENFWARVDASDPHSCWLWTGNIDRRRSDGYGRMSIPGMGRTCKPAHRILWVIANGKDIPDGLCVCHRCDVRECVNPAHLFLGTQEDNMHDMREKKRARTSERVGEKNTRAKLTEAHVKEIRRRHSLGGVTYPELGREYGVSTNTIWEIVSRKRWRHVA